jgi:cyclopropane fatty-acyl-phospholipid synthase-like methyltransferase
MNDVSRKSHWESVYTTKSEKEVSWFQENPAPSLELIALAGLSADAAIIDIGGGASRLVDALVKRNIGRITVLDLSAAALDAAKERLGEGGANVNGWLQMSPLGSQPKPTSCGTTALRFISSPMLPIVPPMSVI